MTLFLIHLRGGGVIGFAAFFIFFKNFVSVELLTLPDVQDVEGMDTDSSLYAANDTSRMAADDLYVADVISKPDGISREKGKEHIF